VSFRMQITFISPRRRRLRQSLAAVSVAFLAAASATARAEVSYNRQVRPILADKCFLCHGPDQHTRKAKLRLDVPESAMEKKAIVPGQPDESGVLKRIASAKPDYVMPPPETHKTLTPAEKALLRSWIAEGAKYERHWAYLRPVKPPVPAGENGVDYLVRERLRTLGLKPAPEADRRTLARRLWLDLVGLAPKPETVSSFEHDSSTNAYARLVDQLLDSPHYGERMAIGWLDVVRFADSIGYHSDNPRNVWPYRDYVIQAFNRNKPFDQFTREQLAGDLLPDSGQEQKVGSAFNRLLLTTEEGGAQPKDYEYRMLTDRVRAVGTVWLGQTLGCAACHDHKFDPATTRDFYSLGAVFSDIKEPIIGRREDGMLVPNATQAAELGRLEAEVTNRQNEFDGPHPEMADAFAAWEKEQTAGLENERRWSPLQPAQARSCGGATLKVMPDGAVLAQGEKPDKDVYQLTFTNVSPRIVGLRLEALPHDSLPAKGPGRAGNGNFVVTEVTVRLKHADAAERKLKFGSARASFEQTMAEEKNPYKGWPAVAAIDDDARGEEFGWAILPEVGKRQIMLLQFAETVSFASGDTLQIDIFQNHGHGHHTLGHFRVSTCADSDAVSGPLSLPPRPEIAKLIGVPTQDRTAGQQRELFDLFKAGAPELASLRQQLDQAKKKKNDFEGELPRCLVTVTDGERRTVHILPRGNFLNEQAGEVVGPALPVYLAGARSGTNEPPVTRLDLANWLVSRENPLTARVTMNRLWKQFFGIGLSKVLDDLGAQGEPPPDQALLDWLAGEFVDSSWDLKHMVRLIVTSETYRQASVPSPELRARDPYNRELACQSRWRLDAELVRDNALSISGLLTAIIGGPSVKPYQPEGYWENLNFPPRTYESSKGEDQYRRGLYVWWQRSYLHPAMTAFDAPSREECAAERNRSNIPQQALVLLNDPTFVEASRAFAIRILQEGGTNSAARLSWAWRQALSRDPQPDELDVLANLLQKFQADYARERSAAEALLKVGLQPVPESLDPVEVAAWANVARAILNLHETVTRS
jgi:hypothetical protein